MWHCFWPILRIFSRGFFYWLNTLGRRIWLVSDDNSPPIRWHYLFRAQLLRCPQLRLTNGSLGVSCERFGQPLIEDVPCRIHAETRPPFCTAVHFVCILMDPDPTWKASHQHIIRLATNMKLAGVNNQTSDAKISIGWPPRSFSILNWREIKNFIDFLQKNK
jgi:hypothetical protein